MASRSPVGRNLNSNRCRNHEDHEITSPRRTRRQCMLSLCPLRSPWLLSAELLPQRRPRGGPVEIAVVLLRPIGVAVLVAGRIGPVVEVGDVLETERLVGEFMDCRPSDTPAHGRN